MLKVRSEPVILDRVSLSLHMPASRFYIALKRLEKVSERSSSPRRLSRRRAAGRRPLFCLILLGKLAIPKGKRSLRDVCEARECTCAITPGNEIADWLAECGAKGGKRASGDTRSSVSLQRAERWIREWLQQQQKRPGGATTRGQAEDEEPHPHGG